MSEGRSVRRRRRRLPTLSARRVGAIGVIVVFALVLTLWIGSGESDTRVVIGSPATPATGPTISGPATSTGGSSSGARSTGTSSPSGGASGSGLSGGTGPFNSIEANASGSVHQVTITATSDSTINAIGYKVAGEKSVKVLYSVGSPTVINRAATGSNALAAVQVQASLYAKYAQCAIAVDGVVRSRNRSAGPYSVAVCVA